MTGETLTKELEVYKKQGANLLMPSTEIVALSEFHTPVIEKVYLSANPEDGDVYPHDSDGKKFRPTKQALMKLSVCAGVIWSPELSRRIDNGADRNYIAYRAVGGIKKPDGQPVFLSADYDIDFEVMEEELRELYEKKAKGQDKNVAQKAEYVEYCVKRDLLQKRKFKLRLCEAGAMNRVLRMLLGIKQAYTIAELQKPFVMARIVFRPDFTDKDVRQQFIDASIRSMTGLYGQQAISTAIKESEPIDVTPIPEDDDPDDDTNTEDFDPQLLDFSNASPEDQATTLYELARTKGYDIGEFLSKAKAASPIQLKPETRDRIFKHMVGLQDKPTATRDVEDDILL